jgi:predicted RNA binding protein YcfA (HicA-like mRNA interferase family)
MLARLPGVQAKDIVRALERAGFEFERQKGSHVTLRNSATARTTVVPMHSGDFPRWLLKRIIREAGMTEDQFRHYL